MNKTGKYIAGRKNLLSIYFTADYPKKGCTTEMILTLQKAGADLIEIGIPFSDPLADGPVIQKSNAQALKNGFTLSGLFRDLEKIRLELKIPLVLMGYFNTVLAFGVERFLSLCKNLNIDTVILPDLPPEIFEKEYQILFQNYGVSPVFLITPQTREARIKYLISLSSAFVYVVSGNSITGRAANFLRAEQINYCKKIKGMKSKIPILLGFGISDSKSYREACKYAKGVIVGSAFIKNLENSVDIYKTVPDFIKQLRTGVEP